MDSTADPQCPARSQPVAADASLQFSIRSLLALTAAIAMVLGYVRVVRPDALPVIAISTVLAVCVGLALGSLVRRAGEAVYWSLLGTLFASLCSFSDPGMTLEFVAVWAWIGLLSGAMAGTVAPGRIGLKIAICGITGFCVMTAPFLLGVVEQPAVDLPGAAAGGMILAGMSELIAELQKRYRTSRDLWAVGLIFGIIVGNLAATAISAAWLR